MPRRVLDRTRLLVLSLVVLVALTVVVLADVIYTIVFAVTVAYALLPPRRLLVDRGYSQRVATSVVTGVAGLALLAIVLPSAFVLYRRRWSLLDELQSLPEEVPIALGEFTFVVETAPLVTAAGGLLRDVALSVASIAPVVALKALLFGLVVYGLLLKPGAVRVVAFGLVPESSHGVLVRFHRRVHETLVGIYLVQAATAVATGVVAYMVFAALGYTAALSLAVVAGVLQFIPVVGPSVVVISLAALDVLAGNAPRAAVVLLVGLVVVGFLPDAVIRPRFAGVAKLPTTLYFAGFVGGVLTLGPVGFVVGPLVIGLLVEAVTLLSVELEDEVPPSEVLHTSETSDGSDSEP
jgi:predicted PurR-regulated permease PerM